MFFSVLKRGGLAIGIGVAVPVTIAVVIGIIRCIRKKRHPKCSRPQFAKNNSDFHSPTEIPSLSQHQPADNDFEETMNNENDEETTVKRLPR